MFVLTVCQVCVFLGTALAATEATQSNNSCFPWLFYTVNGYRELDPIPGGKQDAYSTGRYSFKSLKRQATNHSHIHTFAASLETSNSLICMSLESERKPHGKTLSEQQIRG